MYCIILYKKKFKAVFLKQTKYINMYMLYIHFWQSLSFKKIQLFVEILLQYKCSNRFFNCHGKVI